VQGIAIASVPVKKGLVIITVEGERNLITLFRVEPVLPTRKSRKKSVEIPPGMAVDLV
jgi:hypothetical protein